MTDKPNRHHTTSLAPTLMIQGTGSSVGKSLIVAGLCRYFANLGLSVAPYKSQNMALNAYVTEDGLEVGRAQAVQAWAAKQPLHVDMNPVLLKPETNQVCQVVVMGKPTTAQDAMQYDENKTELRATVLSSLERLRNKHDLVVIEGAGSPAEINLKERDIVNMFIAKSIQAPVVLVGDIDKGGVFAQLVGTLALLDDEERARVKGFIINKFRGDRRLLDDGLTFLEEKTGLPVIGVLDYVMDLTIADEDSHLLQKSTVQDATNAVTSRQADRAVVYVVRYPHMSNIDDFLALQYDPRFIVHFIDEPPPLNIWPDAVILPGSKSTVSDLQWMHARGITKWLQEFAQQERPLWGICGGYQMLGETILDPDGVESNLPEVKGLGLLSITTHFSTEKTTSRKQFRLYTNDNDHAPDNDTLMDGYEIHMASVRSQGELTPLLIVNQPVGTATEGVVVGHIAGTFMHGLFDNNPVRDRLAYDMGITTPLPDSGDDDTQYSLLDKRENDIERLAQIMTLQLDITKLHEIIGLGQ